MSRRVIVILAVSAALVLGLNIFLLRSPRRVEETVLRRPSFAPAPAIEARPVLHNIAPLAQVTASSIDEASPFGEGVADGVVDTQGGWASREATPGAWIKLEWQGTATVAEIELYDRSDLQENVLSGTITFDDGSMIAVPALPPDGSPWKVSITPKNVHWLTFRIDSASGRHAGLSEIMVFGTVAP